MSQPIFRTIAALRRHAMLVASFALVMLWFAFVGYQAIANADPHVVSRPQMLMATLVAQGRLEQNPLRLVVERVWWPETPPVSHGSELLLEDTPTRIPLCTESVILPLAQAPGGKRFRIQSSEQPLAEWPLLEVYPATAAVHRQIAAILGERRRLEGGIRDQR